MKRLPIVIVLLILFAGTISSAFACRKDGRDYPAGAVVDGFRCKADGKWEKA